MAYLEQGFLPAVCCPNGSTIAPAVKRNASWAQPARVRPSIAVRVDRHRNLIVRTAANEFAIRWTFGAPVGNEAAYKRSRPLALIWFEPGSTLDGSRGEPVDQMALQEAEQHRHRDGAQDDAG